ncbi:MAG TPA: asparagine synthase (glutamine-hydrolyzing) [Terriglobia bacterium]|nr:asparagine synthase (glutamine-hydrolyzing) [Terriglobia bacterium]
MCGICGVIGLQEPGQAEALVRRMMSKLEHRGPDDEGLLLDPGLALGMRRLSIIDLPGGHQPLFNEDGSVAVVFNGEIYNFQDLRRTLERAGHRFRTASDTEVIVHAYEEWGASCIERLEGMFAIALAERARGGRAGGGRVLLARDRLGIKPLYYARAGSAWLFASEVRALLATGTVPRRLSSSALHSYLLFGSVGEPMTLVDGVVSLPPGHRLVIPADGGIADVRPAPYWDFARAARQPPDPLAGELRSVTARLRALLEETVERHLISDVPVGVFLSSGIDSTALAALASTAHASHAASKVHTLTVVFPEQEFSEAKLARQTAARLGTDHQELLLSGDDMLARMDEALRALDQPSVDGFNTYFVSWAARQAGLKVALSGLGGDEIFGGYSTFPLVPRLQSLSAVGRWVPAPLRAATAALAERVATSRGPRDSARKLMALWREPESLPHPYFFSRLLFTPVQAAKLMPGGNGAAAGLWKDWLQETARSAEQLDAFAAVSCLEARSYMLSTLLRDADGMSMAHSLEVRVPFLSHPLVEFVTRLPASMKRDGRTPKALLVGTLKELLPDEVVYQTKRTFTLPWEWWLRTTLKERVGAGIGKIASPLEEVLDSEAVEGIWSDFLAGRTRWSRVWSLFVLSEWARYYLAE